MGHHAVQIVLVVLWSFFCNVCGHGRLWEPPSRSSMWRRGFNTSINIDDNELSCGGFMNQWILNSGRCGVCGDPYQQSPRDNENGGTYASGLIPRTYPVGATMDVIVGLTANHGGYFEFKLCPLDDLIITESQECMEKHRLTILNAENGGHRYHIRDHLLVGEIRLSVILPPGLRCKHCVLQWKYRTGTRWGCDINDQCGHGIGPQEEFYGCADIAISDVPNTIYLVPKQPASQDKVGLNDLGSVHQRSIQDKELSMENTSPDIKFIAHTLLNYNTMNGNGGDLGTVNTSNATSNIMIKHLHDHMYMENLLLRSIMTYYNTNKHSGPVNSKQCTAIPKYSSNPIFNEWCRNTCAKQGHLCKPSICSCKVAHNKQEIVREFERKALTNNQENLRSFAKELINESQKNNITKQTPNAVDIANFSASIPVPTDYIHSPKINLMGATLFDVQNTKSKNRNYAISNVRGSSNRGSQNLEVMKSHNMKERPTNQTQKKIFIGQTHSSKQRIDERERDGIICSASAKFAHNAFMANWCTKNCSFGFCPKAVCSCISTSA